MRQLTKSEAIELVKKMHDSKEFIRRYSRKEITLQELNSNGIKLTTPIDIPKNK